MARLFSREKDSINATELLVFLWLLIPIRSGRFGRLSTLALARRTPTPSCVTLWRIARSSSAWNHVRQGGHVLQVLARRELVRNLSQRRG